jgi:hypothetical protein
MDRRAPSAARASPVTHGRGRRDGGGKVGLLMVLIEGSCAPKFVPVIDAKGDLPNLLLSPSLPLPPRSFFQGPRRRPRRAPARTLRRAGGRAAARALFGPPARRELALDAETAVRSSPRVLRRVSFTRRSRGGPIGGSTIRTRRCPQRPVARPGSGARSGSRQEPRACACPPAEQRLVAGQTADGALLGIRRVHHGGAHGALPASMLRSAPAARHPRAGGAPLDIGAWLTARDDACRRGERGAPMTTSERCFGRAARGSSRAGVFLPGSQRLCVVFDEVFGFAAAPSQSTDQTVARRPHEAARVCRCGGSPKPDGPRLSAPAMYLVPGGPNGRRPRACARWLAPEKG